MKRALSGEERALPENPVPGPYSRRGRPLPAHSQLGCTLLSSAGCVKKTRRVSGHSVFPLSFIWADLGTEGLHLKEGVGPLGGEAWLVLATEDPVGQWELDLGVVELLDRWSAALAGCDLLHLHDLD